MRAIQIMTAFILFIVKENAERKKMQSYDYD